MRGFRFFWEIVKRCHFEKILIGFLISFFAAAAAIALVEPEINSYGDALWYTFVASSTIGFGDIAPVTALGRIITVIITVYEIVMVAILAGVIISLYMEVIHRREKLTATVFMDKLEHLSELSPEELKEIENKARTLKSNYNKRSL